MHTPLDNNRVQFRKKKYNLFSPDTRLTCFFLVIQLKLKSALQKKEFQGHKKEEKKSYL